MEKSGAGQAQPPLTNVLTRQGAQDLEVQQEALDLDDSGWNTEALHGATFQQLKKIAKLLSAEELTPQDLSKIVADSFASGPLLPSTLNEVFRDGSLVVRRGDPSQEGQQLQGAGGFAEGLQGLIAAVGETSDRRAKFKQFQVELGEGTVTTTAYYHLGGTRSDGSVEQNSTWSCHWTLPAADTPPQLISVEVREFEEVVRTASLPTMFSDCTEAVVGAHPAYQQQLLFGTAYWRERVQKHLSVFFDGHHGLAVGDVNGDALEDVYVCQPGSLPNRLFVQQPDGTTRDASQESGTDILDATRSALLLDMDNDGDQDLVATTEDQLIVLANDGQGVFTLRDAQPHVRSGTSLSAADYDRDGDLDVYLCVYVDAAAATDGFMIPVPYYDANNGGSNFLLANDGTGRLKDVTSEVGLDQDNRRFSYAAAWEDFDDDGDLDLYVANDFGRNCLYRNDAGHFRNAAGELGLEDMAFGMSVSWGDYNRDGRMDLYVGNMFSAAGNRITFQRQFKTETADPIKAKYQRTARGNSLFENGGNNQFRDVSEQAAVTMGRWSWGSLFTDVNNDGWDDLVVLNGYLTGQTSGDL